MFHNRGEINCSWSVGIQDECYLSIQSGHFVQVCARESEQGWRGIGVVSRRISHDPMGSRTGPRQQRAHSPTAQPWLATLAAASPQW